jgi:LysM repeat protein
VPEEKQSYSMKKMNMLLACLCFFAMSMSAETIYLNANGGCLDRMEYQLIQGSAEKTHTVFRYSPQADTKLFLSVGSNSGNVLDRIPGRLKSCDKIQNWDLNTIRRINVGELEVFIVRQTPQGYTLQKVNAGSWMKQKGQEIEYVGSDMDFKANLGYINYGTPLSSSLSKSEVSMDNFAMFDCSSMISFRQSPNRSNIEQSTFQIIPEIGITSLAFGWDASKATTKMQLKTINGLDYTTVLANECGNSNANTGVVNNGNVQSGASTQGSTRNYSPNSDAVVYYEGSRGIPNSYNYNGVSRPYTPGKPYDSSLPVHTKNDYIPENAIYVGHIGDEEVVAPQSIPQEVPVSYNNTAETAFIIAPQSEALLEEVPVSYDNAQPAIVPQNDVPEEYFTARSVDAPAHPCGASAERGYHLVQKGETLYAISRQYSVSVAQIQEWNALQNSMIKPCMAIRVSEDGAPNPAVVSNTPAPAPKPAPVVKPTPAPSPAPAPVDTYTEKSATSGSGTDMKWLDQEASHTVAAGETVANLAARYGYTEERFRYINGFSRDQTLRIGQQLRTTDCNCLRAPTPYEAEDAAIIQYDTKDVPTTYSVEDTKILTEKSGVASNKSFSARSFIAKPSVPNDYDVVSLAPEGSLVHVVRKEDTLFSLAKRYETTIDAILELNGMDKGEVIIPAQRLYVK